jgi:hypothetical protein
MTAEQPGHEFDVAAWRLGELPPEKLPEAAAVALAKGAETPSLVRLVVLDGAGWSEIEPVLAAVFDDRRQSLPTEIEAVCLLANDKPQRLVAGELDLGARRTDSEFLPGRRSTSRRSRTCLCSSASLMSGSRETPPT